MCAGKQPAVAASHPSSISTREAVALGEQLFFIHPKIDFQAKIRAKAFRKLQDLSKAGIPAIPALIGVFLRSNKQERDLALETLNAIHNSWPVTLPALRQIPVLVKELSKGRERSNRAVFLLSRIGRPASYAIYNELFNSPSFQEYFCGNALRVFAKAPLKKEEMSRVINYVLEKASSALLLTSIFKMAGHFAYLLPYQIYKISAFCNHVSPDVRLAATKALGMQASLDEITLNNLLGLLADEEPYVRSEAIKVLSGINHPTLNQFYDKILARKGVLTVGDLEEMKDKFIFYAKAKAIKLGTVGFQYRWFASDWFVYEAQSALKKPMLTHTSVTKIRELQKSLMNSSELIH